MTKLLSQILQAQEPNFHQMIQKLESISGYQRHDIRFTEDLIKSTKNKISELRLDPEDTTNQELYLALLEKLTQDEKRLIKNLRKVAAINVSAVGNVDDGLIYYLNKIATKNKSYGLKNSVVKRWLITNPPKKTMKMLGYRSITSMLKHEPVALIVIAAVKMENAAWLKNYLENIKKVETKDCETKQIKIFCPKEDRWNKFCRDVMNNNKKTVLVNKELSAMFIYLDNNNLTVKGLTVATLAIALNGLNTILISGSYLKLNQLRTNFGQRLQSIVRDEPKLDFTLVDSNLSWETIQRFFYLTKIKAQNIIEENLGLDELTSWKPVELMISKIEPSMNFWQGTSHLAKHDGKNSVSLNILDVALNLCNQRDYGQHIFHHQQRSLWQEFIIRYIKPELLKQAIVQEMQPKLAYEFNDYQ